MFLKISWNSQYCVCFFAYLHRCFQHALFPRTELILLYINSKCVTSASEWFWKNKSAIDLVCKVNFWSVYFYSIIILIQIAVLGLPLLFSEIVGFGLIQSMQEFLKVPFLVLHFSINDLPNDVVCNIAICADDSTLYSKCDQASDLWQQLELAPELESDLRDTEDWSRKWLVDFNWFHSTGLITLVLLMWKWICLFLRKNRLLRCLGWLSLLNWVGALTLSLLLKLPPRKLEPWFVLWSFFLMRLLCIEY